MVQGSHAHALQMECATSKIWQGIGLTVELYDMCFCSAGKEGAAWTFHYNLQPSQSHSITSVRIFLSKQCFKTEVSFFFNNYYITHTSKKHGLIFIPDEKWYSKPVLLYSAVTTQDPAL